MWSLGVMWHLLVTGKYPFVAKNVDEIKKAIMDKDLVAFEVDDAVNVSPSCKDFIRNHLYKNPVHRCSAEDAAKHPFVLPTIRVMQMVSPLDNKAFLKRLVTDVEVGGLVFDHVRSSLGSKFREPHAINDKELKEAPLFWRDVARFLKIEDKNVLNDLCIVSNEGSFFTLDDQVPLLKGVNDCGCIMALFMSAKNGIVMSEFKAKHHLCATDEEVNKVKALDISQLDSLNGYLALWSKYFKTCSSLVKTNNTLCENCLDVELFRKNLMKFDNVNATIRSLQQEVSSKFKDFPKLAFIAPAVEPSRDIVHTYCDEAVVQNVRSELKKYRNLAQRRVDSGVMNVSEEVGAIAKLWDDSRIYEQNYQNDVDQSGKSLNQVMKLFRSEAEVMCRLLRYVSMLKKALKAEDVRTVYPELRALLQCDYLNVSTESRRVLIRSSEASQSSSSSSSSSSPSSSSRAAGTCDKDHRIAELKQEIETLYAMVSDLKSERARLESERDAIAVKAKETIDSMKEVIATLREKLKENNIPDPTVQ